MLRPGLKFLVKFLLFFPPVPTYTQLLEVLPEVVGRCVWNRTQLLFYQSFLEIAADTFRIQMVWLWEIIQPVKDLKYQHEDLNMIPRTHAKVLGCTGRQRQEGSWRACWAASLRG